MTAALAAPGVAVEAEGLIAMRALALGPAAGGPVSALPGARRAPRRGQGQETADTREYVPGDDIRHLDRGSTARTGIHHIRTFQEERDRAVLLVADFRPPMLWGLGRAFLSVSAAEALALVGWRTVEEGGRVGLLAVTAGTPVVVSVRGRARGMLAVIGGLVRAHRAALGAAAAGPRTTPALDRDAPRIARIVPRGGEVVIASSFEAAGPGFEARLGGLRRRNRLRLLDIWDGTVARLPAGTYPICRADGTRLRARVNARGPRAPYTRRIAGMDALRLDASAPVEAIARHLWADRRSPAR